MKETVGREPETDAERCAFAASARQVTPEGSPLDLRGAVGRTPTFPRSRAPIHRHNA